jgi:hypothetical protein
MSLFRNADRTAVATMMKARNRDGASRRSEIQSAIQP